MLLLLLSEVIPLLSRQEILIYNRSTDMTICQKGNLYIRLVFVDDVYIVRAEYHSFYSYPLHLHLSDFCYYNTASAVPGGGMLLDRTTIRLMRGKFYW